VLGLITYDGERPRRSAQPVAKTVGVSVTGPARQGSSEKPTRSISQ
jgi:hypothetical protein